MGAAIGQVLPLAVAVALDPIPHRRRRAHALHAARPGQGPGVAVPTGIYFALGLRGAHILDALRTWMAREHSTIMIVLYLLIAAKLIGDAIMGFTS